MIDGGLRQKFREYLPTFLWLSIESASTEQGIPDMFYCAFGNNTGWIENKRAQANAIKKSKTLSMQIAWHERYARNGGKSFIAVRRIGREALFIYPGTALRELAVKGLALTPRGYWTGQPAKWNWPEISAILRE